MLCDGMRENFITNVIIIDTMAQRYIAEATLSRIIALGTVSQEKIDESGLPASKLMSEYIDDAINEKCERDEHQRMLERMA